MTLLILAAGMGSRYGGLKQLDPMTEHGEFIIDFSVFDAIQSGFDRVVFVIKEENLEIFRNTIGKRFEGRVAVDYAFQKQDDLPAGFSVPQDRTKPWGTAHALLAARELIHEPFAVINADDFYGRGAYELLAAHLRNAKNAEYCMVGYPLRNTLTENGTVSRGICRVDDNGKLCAITERTAIRPAGDHAVCFEGDEEICIPLDATASMNCWGFLPDIFARIKEGFARFLADPKTNLQKGEYYLPHAVFECITHGDATVSVCQSPDSWYGVTYKEDKDAVKESLAKLIRDGRYPSPLYTNNTIN